MKCKRCDRKYTPEENDLGICCICFRDAAYERVFGEDWRQVVKANFDAVAAADALAKLANEYCKTVQPGLYDKGWKLREALQVALRQYEETCK